MREKMIQKFQDIGSTWIIWCDDVPNKNIGSKEYIPHSTYPHNHRVHIAYVHILHSNLDIVNKSLIPFLFTISNNSLYQIFYTQ